MKYDEAIDCYNKAIDYATTSIEKYMCKSLQGLCFALLVYKLFLLLLEKTR